MTVLTRAELDQQLRAIELWRGSYTIHQIAHDMHVTPQAVDKWLTTWGIIRKCNDCEIILETEEDEFCCVCARRRAGQHWLCGTELNPHEGEPVSFREAVRYAG